MLKRWFILILLGFLFVGHPLWANQDKETEALKAANEWLSIVDGGNYADSWDATSKYFQNSVSKNKWNDALTAFRKPLGEVSSRNVASMKYATELPGAPDGEYVAIQYETSFKNKASSIETVTPILEKDGVWRVSGYFIK